MTLFQEYTTETLPKSEPLAYRLAPKDFDDLKGHDDIIAPGKPLRVLIEQDQLVSLLFWGPPGCGKTALARLISLKTDAAFISLNAVMAKVADLRSAIEEAKQYRMSGRKTIVFIDEIHRFNKAQQDALLPDVENGTIVLIGATTENPYFSVNASLLSRSHLFTLKALSQDALMQVMSRALEDAELEGLRDLSEDCYAFLISQAQGDGRKLLNLLEFFAAQTKDSDVSIDLSFLKGQLQSQGVPHSEDSHYDLTSAFIKSVRGSDSDAALYWLARLLKGGEDPRFIARRLIILASEDIGNADPQALGIACSTLDAVSFIGMPEAQLTLGQATLYMATAPKSNAVTTAIYQAMALVEQGTIHPIPDYLKDAHYKGAKDLGHGTGYQYAHNEADGISAQPCLEQRYDFYKPSSRGFEKTIQKRLDYIKAKQSGDRCKEEGV